MTYFSKRLFCEYKVNGHACWYLSEGRLRCDAGSITPLLGSSTLLVVRDIDRSMYMCGWDRCNCHLNLISSLSRCVLVDEGIHYTSRVCVRMFGTGVW